MFPVGTPQDKTSSSVLTVSFSDLQSPQKDVRSQGKGPYRLNMILTMLQQQISKLLAQVSALTNATSTTDVQENLYLNSVASSNYTITGAFTTIPGMTFALTKAGWWAITISAEIVYDKNDAYIDVQLLCNGNPQTGVIQVSGLSTTSLELFASRMWFYQSMDGNEVIAAQALKTAGAGTSSINRTDSCLSAIWLRPS